MYILYLLNERVVVDIHQCRMAAKFGIFVNEKFDKIPTLSCLPKLHKIQYHVLLLILVHVLLLSFYIFDLLPHYN